MTMKKWGKAFLGLLLCATLDTDTVPQRDGVLYDRADAFIPREKLSRRSEIYGVYNHADVFSL